MSDGEERRVWRAFQAVYRIRLLRPRQPPHSNHPRGGALRRHVEFAVLMKPVFASPAGLVPTVGDVDSADRSMLTMHRCLQVGCQRRQEISIRAKQPSSTAALPLTIAVAVSVKKPLHHLLRRRDDARELKRRGLAPRSLL